MQAVKRAMRDRQSEAGFTMVEMMIIVVVVGILSLIGVASVRKYVTSSKTSEATEMITTIKGQQEAYKGETFQYLDVTGTLDNYYPNNANAGRAKTQWGGGDPVVAGKWQQLGVNAAGPVLFRYSCVAGASTVNVVSPGGSASDLTVTNWPTTVPGPWYVVKAEADFDGDGRHTVFVGTSFSGEMFGKSNQ
jgi:Tfp pilus assembly protein PilE